MVHGEIERLCELPVITIRLLGGNTQKSLVPQLRRIFHADRDLDGHRGLATKGFGNPSPKS